MENTDLFGQVETLPKLVQVMIENYNMLESPSYEDTELFLKKLKWTGYEFEYCLDGVPFGLREMPKMEKPFKYMIVSHKGTQYTNIEPQKHQLETWVPIGDGVSKLMQTKECYIDTRYEAKRRLYNYIMYTKRGLEIPKYDPYKNTDPEVGKTIPILNDFKKGVK